jgi:hypothetical protein
MSRTLSRTPIKIKVSGSGLDHAEGELIKVLAPLTVETILRRLPLEGRAHPCRGGRSIIIGLKRGEEKSVRHVKAGTIAYWPMSDALCLFNSDTSTYSPVNRVGKITRNLELIGKITSGARLRIEAA